MRHLFLLLAVLFVVALLGSDSPREYDDRAEHGGLDGAWQLTAYGIEGKLEAPDDAEVLTYRSTTITFRYGSGDFSEGRCRVGSAQKPARLDIVGTKGIYKGDTFRWIYEIDGDTLRIAGDFRNGYQKHPQAFTDRGLFVWVYKRIK